MFYQPKTEAGSLVMFRPSVNAPLRWQVLALIAIPSALLFTWTVLEAFGFYHPVIDFSVTVMILACLPFGWCGVWLKRRRTGAADNALRARLRAIIAAQSLVILFQPIVDARTRLAIGAEALSRFMHLEPKTTPDVWFAEAARVGMGTDLELLAARMALDAGRSLPEHVYVSVNLSPPAILTGQLATILDRTRWNPARVVLEITEHASVEDYPELIAALADLRRTGLRLAVDDAGAGYASFRHILALAPDYIKLDRSLVTDIDTDPGRRALTSAVITFASDIGAAVIAEGVETEAELRTVQRLGVRAVQGYLTGRPDLPSAWADNDTFRAHGVAARLTEGKPPASSAWTARSDQAGLTGPSGAGGSVGLAGAVEMSSSRSGIPAPPSSVDRTRLAGWT